MARRVKPCDTYEIVVLDPSAVDCRLPPRSTALPRAAAAQPARPHCSTDVTARMPRPEIQCDTWGALVSRFDGYLGSPLASMSTSFRSSQSGTLRPEEIARTQPEAFCELSYIRLYLLKTNPPEP